MKKRLHLPIFIVLLTFSTLSAQPSSPANTLMDEGIALHDKGQYKAAIEKYEQALKIDSKNAYAWYEIGNSYMALEDYKKAIVYSDKVIDAGVAPLAEAYMLKGNALDLLGKPDKAMKVYREGIAKQPHYLLYYNVGVTLLKQNKSQEAIVDLRKALELKASHPGSNYCLGVAYSSTTSKTKTLLPLYYFLLEEVEGIRAKNAYILIAEALSPKIEQKGENNFVITLDANLLTDEFKTVETFLSLNAAAEAGKDKPDSLKIMGNNAAALQKFVKTTTSFFEILSRVERPTTDTFWWDHYADFFVDLYKNGHAETFAYYVAMASGEPAATTWLTDNKSKLDAFAKWIESLKGE